METAIATVREPGVGPSLEGGVDLLFGRGVRDDQEFVAGLESHLRVRGWWVGRRG